MKLRGEGTGRPEDPAGAHVWGPVPSGSDLGHEHRYRPGRLDESERRLGHEELVVAALLAREGHEVRSQREVAGAGPVADLLVCGRSVEVKSWLPLEERSGRAPGARSVFNKLVSASRQADAVVLNGRGCGLTVRAAGQGMLLYAQRRPAGSLAAIRVLGDGFDLSWAAHARLARDRPANEMRVTHRRPSEGLHL